MKKQMMVTNRRDRNLLVLLAVLVIAFLLYNYVITPALERAAFLKDELAGVEIRLTDMNQSIVNYPQLQKEEQELRSSITEKYEKFYYSINQERILYKLDSLIAQTGLAVNRYACTNAEIMPISFPLPEYIPEEYPLRDMAAAINPSLQNEVEAITDSFEGESIRTTDITLDFTGMPYGTAVDFLRSVELMDKSVIVRNVSLLRGERGIDGQLVLAIFSLPKIDDTDKDILRFEPVIPKGKNNPFS